MEFAGHCTCVCALDAVRNIQGASRWAAKAHSQEWLCHGTPENRPWFSFPCAGISLRRPSGTQIRWVGIVPSTSCWAKVFGVPLGLAWRKFRLSRTSGTPLYLRMCVVEAVRNISRGFHPGGKTHSQEWLCHVPSTSYWAKVFGVPLGLAWRKFRSSRTSETQYLRMCVVNAVGNIQGASTRAEKRTARNGCATYPAIHAGLKSSASLWDLRGENSD